MAVLRVLVAILGDWQSEVYKCTVQLYRCRLEELYNTVHIATSHWYYYLSQPTSLELEAQNRIRLLKYQYSWLILDC